ncbi:MAG: hypothetical protein HDR71_17855 [Lachnospiraceae bacterium]|nr:hypothetical protein [Lachnospiraceae bacterium]
MHYEKFQDGTVKCIEDEIPFEVPEGWEWCRVRNISSVKGGKRLPKGMMFSDIITNHAYIRVTDMKNRSINKIGLKYISDEVFSSIKAYTISKDDLYVTIAGTIGVVGEIPDELNGSNLTENAVKVCNIFINKTYLCYILLSTFVQEQFQDKTHQVAMPKLALERILSTLIPIAPIRKQSDIVQTVENVMYIIDEIEINKNELETKIMQIKSKILDFAIRGKLVPQNPDDESASVLLDRIRVEKEELIKQGKIKRDKQESIIFRGDDNSYYEKIGDTIENIDSIIPFNIPDNWEFIRFKELWELISGRDLSPAEYNEKNIGIPYITGASNFNKGNIELVRWTSNPQVITHTGDLLITCKGTIGEMAFNYFGDAHIARQIMAIRNIFNLNAEYLSLCIFYYINTIKRSAKGLIPGISREDILNLILPLPPVDYQNEVALYIKKTNDVLHLMEKSLI